MIPEKLILAALPDFAKKIMVLTVFTIGILLVVGAVTAAQNKGTGWEEVGGPRGGANGHTVLAVPPGGRVVTRLVKKPEGQTCVLILVSATNWDFEAYVNVGASFTAPNRPGGGAIEFASTLALDKSDRCNHRDGRYEWELEH